MILHFFLFMAVLILLKKLTLDDQLHLSVRRLDIGAYMLLSLTRSILWQVQTQENIRAVALALLFCLLAATALALPFFLLAHLSKNFGMADAKYIWASALFLPYAWLILSLLFACLWAAFSHLKRTGLSQIKEKRQQAFAFLPYLIFSTLPAIALSWWPETGALL